MPPPHSRCSNPKNIGHLISDEYFAAFAAMELFDVVTAAAQMMLVRPCAFDADACARGYNESMRGLSLHPARTLDSYAAATCFRRVIMGYSMALGPRLLLHLHTALRPQIQAFFCAQLGARMGLRGSIAAAFYFDGAQKGRRWRQ